MLVLDAILPYSVVLIFSLIFLYLLNNYLLNVKNQTNFFKYLLFFLRISSIFLLLIVLYNPIFKITHEFIKNKKVVFFIDNSKSLSSLKASDLIINLNNNKKKLNEKGIDTEYYIFGDSLKKINSMSEITFNDRNTDFNDIINNINKIDASEYILISDGMHNVGMVLKDNDILNPIYSFGIDQSSELHEDLKIDSLKITSNKKDSLHIKCQISVNVNNDYKNIKINLSNKNYSDLNISNITIDKGKNVLNHEIVIAKDYLSDYNIIEIQKIDTEFNFLNNFSSLKLNYNQLKQYKAALFSGRLSNNTKIIKKILNNNDNIIFEHFFRKKDLDDFINNNYDIIIFDSFPINNEQIQFINNNKINSLKFLYFHGPSRDDDLFISNRYLSNFGYKIVSYDKNLNDLYLKPIINDNFVNNIINQIVPISSNILVSNKKKSSIVDSKNNSVLIDYLNDSLFVFLPDLKTIANETKRFYDKDNLSHLIDYYINKTIAQKDILKLYSNETNFNINDSVEMYLRIEDNYFENHLVDLFIYNKNNDIVYKIDSFDLINDKTYRYSIKLDEEGKYSAKVFLRLDNENIIQSNRIEFNILKIDEELYNIGLNEDILRKISFDSNGDYFSIENLSGHINQINDSKLNTFKTNKIKLFNFQPFWFIILFLLIIEWIIRKNKGLL